MATYRVLAPFLKSIPQSHSCFMIRMGFLAWSAIVSLNAWSQSHYPVNETHKSSILDMSSTATPDVESSSANTAEKGLKHIMDTWIKESEEHNRKLSEVASSISLSPATLLSKTAITATRKKIHEAQNLISKQSSARQRYVSEVTKYIHTVDIDEASRQKWKSSFEESTASSSKISDELANAQLATFKSYSDMLNFAERNFGTISTQNNQLIFKTQNQMSEYQRLVSLMQKATKQEDVATKKMEEFQQKNQQMLIEEHYNK